MVLTRKDRSEPPSLCSAYPKCTVLPTQGRIQGGGLRVAPPFGKFRACLTAPVYHFLITEIIAYCCFIFATPPPPHLKKSWIRPCVLSFQPNTGDDFGDISDIKRDLDCESSAAISAFAIQVVPVTDVSFSELDLLSEYQVRDLIMSSTKKSCLIDPVPITLLIDCLDVFLSSITKMINLSLFSGGPLEDHF